MWLLLRQTITPHAERYSALAMGSCSQTAAIVVSSRQQKSMILLKLRGIDTIDDANKLRGKELCISRDDVELEDGVVFIADLIGLPVIADGVEIGKITEVLTLPGNDVYVVKGEHEYMIPAVQEYVEPLDISEGCVRVTLIEGMQTDAD